MKPRIPAAGYGVLLARLWHHLGPRRRRQFALLLGLMSVSAFAEVVSLGAVLPFLGILTAPAMMFKNPLVARAALAWGVVSADRLVLPLTAAFAATALIAGAMRMLLLWASTRLAYGSGADLSIEVYRRTLYQPYRVHVARNSSLVISGIITKVDDSVWSLYNLLMLLSSSMLLSAIMLALVVINPVVATTAAAGVGISYVVVGTISRRQLRRNSECIAREQTQVVKALQEGLGGIRDVLLDGSQPAYCDIYRRADQPLRHARGNNIFINGSPRFAMEASGMTLIAALAYGMSRQPGGVSAALPVLGVLALGAQRMIPAVQQVYSAWATIASSHTALADTIELLDQPLPAEASKAAPEPLAFQKDIRFADVRFRFTDDGPWVLDGLNVAIPKGARVGFVGSTGSGKSTTLDLLMGLLTPIEGKILVDGRAVEGDRIRPWQRAIAHVPQNIYLADATLAENIAFGVPRGAIDLERVRQAARQAQIAGFIEGRPEGYDAFVGERGIRLSGGQRQRIGIARALYKRASVLIFDEATSALDSATEQSVMEAVENLSRELTILLIAHRLTTVRHCDILVELDRGRVAAQGTYEHLLECSPSFQKMARVAG
jgi:ATP-binding cassette subfamily B protein